MLISLHLPGFACGSVWNTPRDLTGFDEVLRQRERLRQKPPLPRPTPPRRLFEQSRCRAADALFECTGELSDLDEANEAGRRLSE